MPFNYFNVQDIYVKYNENNYVNLQVISEVHASDFTHIKNRFSLKICNLNIDLIFLQVDIVYLAGRGQKYATTEKDTCILKKSWKDLCHPPAPQNLKRSLSYVTIIKKVIPVYKYHQRAYDVILY